MFDLGGSQLSGAGGNMVGFVHPKSVHDVLVDPTRVEHAGIVNRSGRYVVRTGSDDFASTAAGSRVRLIRSGH